MLRALHCSDLHLHAAHADHAIEVVRAIAASGARHEVDVVLIAGDVFDHPAQPARFVERIAEELGALEQPLVAIPGNHDIHETHTGSGAIDELFALLDGRGTLLDHAGGESVDAGDGRLRVWGRGMPEHTPANNPLEGLPAMPADGAWNIVLAHGQLAELGGAGRSSPIAFEPHARELASVHYVALGHRHAPTAHRFRETPVHYSGSASTLVGRGTIAIATFDGERTEVETHLVGAE